MGWIQHLSATVMMLVVATGDVGRPRGVPLSRASLYNPTKDFTCFDGSSTIPFSQVNDDYCDCFDGSDEPGTSACINGIFHCANAGHKPQNIPSSRVNDGVCDCCDGTDEYREGGRQCVDTCDELGREARAEAARRAELLKTGSQLRAQLIESGSAQRREMAQQLVQLEKDKDEADRLRTEKEAVKNEWESKENEALQVYREAEERARGLREAEEEKEKEREARETFGKYDSDGDGFVTQTEIKTRATFDKNRDGEVDDEEARHFLAEHEQVDIETFVSEAWSRIKPFLMAEQGLFKPPSDSSETETEATDADLGEGDEDTDQFEPEETEHEETDEDHPDTDDKPAEEPVAQEDSQTYDARTQEIVDATTEARKQFTEAERSVREIDGKIKDIQDSLEKDYGPQHEFLTLDKTCLEYEDKEYVYKLCVLDKVTQKARSGGHEVSLGSWAEWAGTEGNRYSVMKYTGGQSCWNGPSRNTHVNVDCGVENKVVSVSEPSRCEYLMELQTPAACDDSRSTTTHSHDEL